MKTLFSFFVGLGVLAIGTVPASAASIALLPADANCLGCSNILFQSNDSGNPLYASTQGGFQVILNSVNSEGDLFAPSNGQARVQLLSGGGMSGLLITFDALSGVGLFEFTVQPHNGNDQGVTPADKMVVSFNNNAYSFNTDLSTVGQNRYTWKADGGETIRSVNISFSNGTVSALEQIRLTEASGSVVTVDAVPEPASVVLLGGGLLACGILGRRRRNRRS